MKFSPPILLFALLSPLASAFTESFDGGWSDGSYSGVSTYTSPGIGIWVSQDSLIESANARSGDCVRMDYDRLSPYLEFQGLDGNGVDGGVATVSFWFRHWDADGSTIEFDLQHNVNGAGWVTFASGSCNSTTYEEFTSSPNIAGDNILIRIIPTVYPERLLIDDFSLTTGGSGPTEPGISFQSSTSSASESDGTLTIPVTINPADSATVDVTLGSGTATTSGDFTLQTTSLTFTAQAPTQNIILTINDDSSVEPEETIILTLANPTGATIGTGTHTVTLADNDVPTSNGEELVIVAANTTSGNYQSYQPPGERIFQALDPDIVGIQEFNVDGTYRDWVDDTFGEEFYYYVEPGGEQIPNGIVSRYPIIASGEWIDTNVSNRDFAWATIDIPGNVDLHVISVHFLTTSSSNRNAEAEIVINNVTSQFPSTDYIVLCGDFNTNSRSESAINTLKAVFSDDHVPVDQNGNDGTNAGRNDPYDWVMPNDALDELHSSFELGGLSFPNGHVFDTRVWASNPGTVPAPALSGDSGASMMQHMAVVKTFTLPTPSIVSFQSSNSTATEGDSTLQIPVFINPADSATVDVSVTSSTATSPDDFTLLTSSLTFSAQNPTQTISLSIADDSLVESDETITITLTNPNGAELGTATHTITLSDNDFPPTETPRGTPYSWLESYGITSNYDAEEEIDHDGDGYPTWQEYLSNTDPFDSNSRLCILSITDNGSSVDIVCETQPQRLYSIEFSDTLESGETSSWAPFATSSAGQFTETASSTSNHTFTDDFSSSTTGNAPPDARRFYRVRVSLP